MAYSYCATLTNTQLINVYNDEKARVKRTTGDVKKAAKELLQEAREELIRRGMDEYL